MATYESTEEFCLRHGNDSIRAGGMLLFGNGAETDDQGMLRREPPQDEASRLRLRHRYISVKLKRAEETFATESSALSEQCANAFEYPNMPVPDVSAVTYLKSLKKIVLQFRKELEAIKVQIANSPEGQRRKRQDAERERRRQRNIAVSHAINSISINNGEPEPDKDKFLETRLEALAQEEGNFLFAALAQRGGVTNPEN